MKELDAELFLGQEMERSSFANLRDLYTQGTFMKKEGLATDGVASLWSEKFSLEQETQVQLSDISALQEHGALLDTLVFRLPQAIEMPKKE